jgi:hypothetical protein
MLDYPVLFFLLFVFSSFFLSSTHPFSSYHSHATDAVVYLGAACVEELFSHPSTHCPFGSPGMVFFSLFLLVVLSFFHHLFQSNEMILPCIARVAPQLHTTYQTHLGFFYGK